VRAFIEKKPILKDPDVACERAKTGLYQKHVEELAWKAVGNK